MTFFQDLWQDLREKRLWPVAVLLLAALVALPVLLFKPAKDAGPAGQASAETTPDAAARLALQREGAEESSDLGVFDPKDPFKAPPGALPPAPGAPSSTAPAGSSTPVSPVGTSPSSGAGTSASGGGSSSGTSSGRSGTSTKPAPSPPTRVTRKTYTYVVDLRFGERGEVKRRKGVRRLTLLPSSRNPLLVFLGVTDDRRRAVFLVERGLSQEGEGTCKPSRRHCSFLYLRTANSRDDHYFSTADGKQYVLHLSRIRRVEVKRKRKRAGSSAKRPSSPEVGPGAIFESPVFADERR